MVIRKNVWRLGTLWADDVLWYARGVRAMAQRALAAPTSWRFYAGIHGFDAARWTQLGYLSSTDQPPSQHDVATFWFQCQHGSWYFLPWHRGYLFAFEANVRQAIAGLGGPSESWALPYWNYFADGEARLPAEFASASWPDGKDDNPLFVVPRYGPDGDGNVFIPVGEVNMDALGDPDFTGVASGGGTGFGGVDTGFSHNGQVHGGIETQPHDYVHGLIGGAKHNVGPNGAMADPRTAALDPIFWLHHANIDRLWQSWLMLDPGHTDPVDPDWRGGPAHVGQRPFCMPMPDGSTWTYTPDDMISTTALGYEYDDLDPDGRAAGMLAAAEESAGPAGGGDAVVPGPDRQVEMVGASEPGVPLRAAPTEAVVALDGGQLREASQSIGAMTESAGSTPPERVLLNLENVRGTADATTFSVYVGLPAGAEPGDHPELLAGSIGLFGLSQASDPQGENAGEGITYVLDITNVVRDARLDGAADTGRLPVTLVPVRQGAVDPDVTIGRVSVFRQRG